MIHMSNSAVMTVIPKVEAEVVSAPNPMPVPRVRTSVLANLERGFSKKTLFEGNGRTLLWDGLGEDVSTANSAREVCKIAGLDYTVNTEPIFTADGVKIPNMVATRRYDAVGEIEENKTHTAWDGTMMK